MPKGSKFAAKVSTAHSKKCSAHQIFLLQTKKISFVLQKNTICTEKIAFVVQK